MNNQIEEKMVVNYLQSEQGKSFTGLGIQDESQGRWVRDARVRNKHLTRHLKVSLKLQTGVGGIGWFLYHNPECKKLIGSHDFWHNSRGQRCFWYAWV